MNADTEVDWSKMEKLPAGCGFFDVNEWWYFPNRWAVRKLYPLPITANHITILALVSGMVSAIFYFSGSLIWGALFLYGKLFLDNVDGSLARLRGEESRLGRVLDSFSDFVVTALVYWAITLHVAQGSIDPGRVWVLGGMALLSALLHCSYWVFYYVKYTDLVGSYEKNRADESVTPEDQQAFASGQESPMVYFLQRFHNLAYGWQDALIEELDRIGKHFAKVGDEVDALINWYNDKRFLEWMGPLCICTNTMAFVVFSLFGQLETLLYIVVFAGNSFWLGLMVWKVFKAR